MSLQGKWIPVSMVLNIVLNQFLLEQVIIKDNHVIWYKCSIGKTQLWRLYTFQRRNYYFDRFSLHACFKTSSSGHKIHREVHMSILKYIDIKTLYLKVALMFSMGYFKTNIKLCKSPTGKMKLRFAAISTMWWLVFFPWQALNVHNFIQAHSKGKKQNNHQTNKKPQPSGNVKRT